MEDEIEECIRKRVLWPQLPSTVKKLLGDSPKEYERYVFEFSIKNQLRYRGSLVRTIHKDERKYYETLIHNSIQRLMLYPYHLADMIVKGLRITPFIYYVEVVALLIELEKSYDTMPNFTAADCLRLLGIGRNEYLELVAKARSLGRRGRSKSIRALLPRVPLNIPMQPWWRVELGYVLEEDVKPLSESERVLIDMLIDRGSQTAGTLDYNVVKTLYRRGLVYLDVPITAADKVSVPPLKGFVMNRIAGDYFETLLYKVFVSIDEHTSVAELATVLQVECELVKQAVSLYCRLGFANNLKPPPVSPHHPSWDAAITTHNHPPYRQISPLTFESSIDEDTLQMEPVLIKQAPSTSKQSYQDVPDNISSTSGRRVAVLFDSTLAAYLMMGNLSPDLKSHAVTLFEVGKLSDESLDSLLMELDKVVADPEIEGEARRYLAAAACLRIALRSLRPRLRPLDLLRCEALHALGAPARARLLATKYRLAISTAPLCREARAGAAAGALPHVGPAPPETSTPWMRLYLYHVAGYGPPTLLLKKGTHLRAVPRLLLGYSRVSVSWWGAEAALEGAAGGVAGGGAGGVAGGALPAAAALAAANSAARRGPVLLQALGVRHPAALRHLMFPPDAHCSPEEQALWSRHAGLRRLVRRLRLQRSAGYVTLADTGVPDLGCARPPAAVQLVQTRKKKDICGIAKPVSEVSTSSADSFEKSTEEYSKSNSTRLQSPIESHFAVTPSADSKTSSPANGFTSVECGQLLCEELDNLAINDQSQSKESIAYSDDLVPIHSSSTSIESLKDKIDKHSDENSINKETIDDIVPVHSPVKKENADQKSMNQLNDLLSPTEDSISMFTQLSDKLAEMSTTEGDSGVDTATNISDDETCRPEKWTILDLQFGIPLFDEVLCEKICNCIVDKIAKPELLEKVKEDNDFIRTDVLKFVSQCQYYPGEDMGIVKRGTLVPLPRKNLAFENGRISEWAGK